MPSLFKKSPVFFVAFVLIACPLYGQHANSKDSEQPLIEQGAFLTGFSLSLINASREDYNQDFEREFTDISVQVDGLYFINNRLGIGPLLGYRYIYRDLEDPFRAGDRDTRNSAFEYGIKGGWYIPAATLFGGTGDPYFFIDGGVSWLRTQFKREPDNDFKPQTEFGLQLGTGVLFPVGKRIGIETKLGFQARRRDLTTGFRDVGGKQIPITETKWFKELALSVGLKVGF